MVEAHQPCGQCASCRVYPSGNHPDYHYIYRQLIRIEKSDVKARDLSIDVIRPYLLEPASRKPAMKSRSDSSSRMFSLE